MILGEPSRTPYDLHFQMFDIPVRVHPLFWIMTIVLGFNGVPDNVEKVAGIGIWVLAVFFSILMHEFGHALLMKRFGMAPYVVLHMMGGLAIPTSGGYSMFHDARYPRSRFNWRRMAVVAAGPGIQLVFAMLIIGALLAFSLGTGRSPWDLLAGMSPYVSLLIDDLLYINIAWALLNMLPVYPLDGGQFTREVLVGISPWQGTTWTLWLSIITCIGLIGLGYMSGDWYLAILFASFAISNYQMLQFSSGGGQW